ncbi:MAG: hypothetical protein J2P17_22755 [Mycobacterium sp.]|nr:hypothetical protein [Mycobacterium sp.]
MTDTDTDLDTDDESWRKSFILDDRSACLCDHGAPGYTAAVLVAADGRHDYALVDQGSIGTGTTYDATTPQAEHEQLGALPDDFLRRVELSRLRCSRITAAGRRCRTRVHRPGESCWRHTADR